MSIKAAHREQRAAVEEAACRGDKPQLSRYVFFQTIR
jgi:hypothetical protein